MTRMGPPGGRRRPFPLPLDAGPASSPRLGLDGTALATPPVFGDGEALWTAVCKLELESVVAKRLTSSCGANERLGQDEGPSRFWLPPGCCRCNKIGISSRSTKGEA